MANEIEDIDFQNDGKEILDLDKKQEELDAKKDEELDPVALKEQNRHLFARAKRAEGFVLKDGKWIKKEKPIVVEKKPEAKDTTTESLTREEAVMIAKGTDLEDLDQLKLVQKATGLSMKEAEKHPLYQGYIAQKRAEEKKKKSQLGASNGGRVSVEDKINKPGLTREEHMALWEKENG